LPVVPGTVGRAKTGRADWAPMPAPPDVVVAPGDGVPVAVEVPFAV